MRNIFIVTRGIPSKKYPLNGIFEFDQAKALRDNGCNVTLVVLDFRSIRRYRKFGIYFDRIDNIDCFFISAPLGNIENIFFNTIARIITKIGAYIIKHKISKPDIIHSHFVQTSSLALEIKQTLNVPLVVTEHSSLINKDYVAHEIEYLAKKVYYNSDRVIAVSNALAKKLKFHFNIIADVVPNIVDTTTFNPSSKVFSSNIFEFISVGSLDYNKGFDLLIDAFYQANFTSKIKLKIIGSGDFKFKLLEKVKRLNLTDNIYFIDYLSREEIANEFNLSNSFVLASRSETFGLVYIEALLSGLPVIATKCGGPEDFINSSNGLLVDINNIEALSKGMIYMVKNWSNYNKFEISYEIKKNYSSNKIASMLISIYDQITIK